MIALRILGEEMLVPSTRVHFLKLTETIKPKNLMSEEAKAQTNKQTDATNYSTPAAHVYTG